MITTTKTAQRSLDLIPEIRQQLEAGEVIVLPTDIAYILVAHALKPEAIARIWQLKQWKSSQPLMLLTRQEKVEKYGVVSQSTAKLIAQFPFPITLIIPKKDAIPETVTAGHKTLFISCPDEFIYDLVGELPFPIVCSPTGISVEYKATKFQTAMQYYDGQVSLLVDGGRCKYDTKATLIDCTLATPTILNFGTISVDDLRPIVPEIELPSHLRK